MNSHSELAAATRRILTGQSKRLDAWSERYQKRGGRICCGRGCSNCCKISVRITLPEALVLLDVVGAEAWAKVRASVERLFELAVVARDETDYVLRHGEIVGPCPLLAEDGACTVHAQRPLPCRGLLSTMPGKYCDDGFLGDLRLESPTQWGEYLKGLDPRVNEVRLGADSRGLAWASHVVRPAQEITAEESRKLTALMRERFGFCVSGQLALMLCVAADESLMRFAEERDRAGFVQALAALPGYHERLIAVE